MVTRQCHNVDNFCHYCVTNKNGDTVEVSPLVNWLTKPLDWCHLYGIGDGEGVGVGELIALIPLKESEAANIDSLEPAITR